MAIRLIDQYPNRAGVPNDDYPHGVPRNKSTPTATDGTPFEQAWFRDQEGFFQGLLETAGITPSGSPDTVEQSDYFDALVSAMHGVTEIDVGGAGDVTLGIYPSRVAALRLTGTLGADVDLIVPDTERLYTIIDETTGGFNVTVRTESGTGVTIGESVSVVRSDGTDVVSANPAPDLGQNIAVFDTAGVTEWAVPGLLKNGLRKAHVTVVGGGGGGSSVDNRGGGGGGGGGIGVGMLDLSGVASVDITIGSGGANVSGNAAGNGGGSSSFGAYISATGGEGGTSGGSGGTGGTGSGGEISSSLGPGDTRGGGDGLSEQSSGSGGGPGGRGSVNTTTAPGRDAVGPGGGGSGGVLGGASGSGASGIVIVRW